MALSSPVVPMPRWSAVVGCTKFGLAIIILAFVAACTAIWGCFPAFSITLFTGVLSLLAFCYYFTALTMRPSTYNKWLILLLEALLTAFWLISLVLLAGWTAESGSMPRFLNDSGFYEPVSERQDTRFARRAILLDLDSIWLTQLQMVKRNGSELSRTPVKVHDQNAQAAARALAGISTGLAGLIFALYAATFITFAINFNKPTTGIQSTTDEQALSESRNNYGDPTAAPVSPATPTFTQPLRVKTLLKDFEPKPQTQKHYLTPAQAAEAGVEPPTPVLRAQRAERDDEVEKTKGPISLSTMLATAPIEMEKAK